MATPNSNYTDLITTTLEYMGEEIADAVSANNAVTAWLKANDGWSVIEGGEKIVMPLAHSANGNTAWYSGFDTLAVGANDEFSAAEFAWKQIAAPIASSGLEIDVQNVGKARRFDLLKERIKNARRSLANTITTGIFSDGTGSGSKQLTGLAAMCPTNPAAGTYGGINRATATNAFWRPQVEDTATALASDTFAHMMTHWNTLYAECTRGSDRPNLIVTDADVFGLYESGLQLQQRFEDPKLATLGFDSLRYKGAAVVLDGSCTDVQAYFLNTDFMGIKVASNRNFKALPAREAFNQDASVVFVCAALNMVCSNNYIQGRLSCDS